MKEIQSAAIPNWVMMDQRFQYKVPSSFRADGETSAETKDTNGQPVRVSLDIRSPPGSSQLCLHLPAERESTCWWDTVVAAHRDAVLFRIEVDFDELPVNRSHAMNCFIYRAPSSGPKLTLLPRCYSARDDDASRRRGKWRMLNTSRIGLLAAEEEKFVVAELSIDTSSAADRTAPLEAELFRLISSSSNAAGVQWEVTHARSHGSSRVSFQDVIRWETHRVVPFTSYLCWANYNQGLLFCDVLSKTPHLQYLPLPVDDDMPRQDFPTFSRTVCVTDQGHTMKFVKVSEMPSCPSCRPGPGPGFTISVFTMNGDMKEWVVDAEITEKALWGMEGYDHDHLPCSVPQFPLVSMDDPHILYFVVTGRPASSSLTLSDETTWIVTLDITSNTVLRYDGIKGFPSDNIFSGFGFFPSDFTTNLIKHSRSAIQCLR